LEWIVAVKETEVLIDYTNWRGERRVRRIRPTGRLLFESNEYHPDKQYLVEAIDVEVEGLRTFALNNIHSWRQLSQ
jgi:hypothetical protein